jgi:hypothetical protein
MAVLDSYLELLWTKELDSERRESARDALHLIDQLEGEQRVKLLAAFCWASWCRGRAEARVNEESSHSPLGERQPLR